MATQRHAAPALSDDEIRLLADAIQHNTVLGCDFEDARFVSEQAGHTIPAAVDEMLCIRNAISEVPGAPAPGQPLLHEGGVYIPFLAHGLPGLKSPDACMDGLRCLHIQLAEANEKLEANSLTAEPRPIADVVDGEALRAVIVELAMAKAKVWRLEAGRKILLPVAEKAWLATRVKKEPESREILAKVRGVLLQNDSTNYVIIQSRMFVELPVSMSKARTLLLEVRYLSGTIVSSNEGWKIDAKQDWDFLTEEQFKVRQRERRHLCS